MSELEAGVAANALTRRKFEREQRRRTIRHVVTATVAVLAWGFMAGLTAGLWGAWHPTMGPDSVWFGSLFAWPIILPAIIAARLV